MREVERRANRKSFPQEETKTRYCKCNWPRGFCREGIYAEETDGEINRSSYSTEDHPPVHTHKLSLPASLPPSLPLSLSLSLAHLLSIISSLSSPLSLSHSVAVLWRMGIHCQGGLRGEKSVFLFFSGVFSFSSAWLSSWAVNSSPGLEDEEDLFVRKTQQRKRKQGATGWWILRTGSERKRKG